MRRAGWLGLMVWLAFGLACGPNAAPRRAPPTEVIDGGLAEWTVVPTPTPRPTPTGPTATPPPFPTPGPTPLATATEPPRPPVPTPNLLPVDCQFSDGAVSVPLPLALTPTPASQPTSTGVPPDLQPLPGLTMVASSEPVPGVTLDLLVPSTTLLAGSVIQTQVVVHNNTPTSLMVEAGAYARLDGQPDTVGPTDPREFPARVAPQPPLGPSVPSGQTWALSSLVQVPFDASAPSHLHAAAQLAFLQPPGTPQVLALTTVTTEVPLQLTPPGPDQELQVELHADQQQWCVKATTASGDPPAQPLLLRVAFEGPRVRGLTGADSGGTNVWAGRWNFGQGFSNGVPLPPPTDAGLNVTAYVGSPNYVTSTAQQFVSP